MKNVWKVLKWAKPYRWMLALAMIGMLGTTGINLAAPRLLTRLIDIVSQGVTQAVMPTIYTIGLILAAAYLLRLVFRYWHNYFAHKAAWNLVADLRVRVYDHLQKLSLRYYHDKQTGQLMSRTVNDTANLEMLIAHALPDLLTNTLLVIGIVAILLTINVRLALLAMSPVPLIIVGCIWFTQKVRPMFRLMQAELAEMNATLQDNFSGMKEIQIFNQQAREKKRVLMHAENYTAAMLRALRRSAVFNSSMDYLSSIGTVIVVVFGAVIALSGGLNVADIVGFILYLSMFYAPIQALGRIGEELAQALAGMDRVFEVLDIQPDIVDKPGAVDTGTVRGHVTLEQVSFAYQKDTPVLENISINVEPGQMIALVGPTGVGKSTLVSLIARFYDPDGGCVRLDGHDLRDVTLSSLRSNISIVLQDVFLFNGTIWENITYGLAEASREQVEAAARAAHIHDFILSTPQGYETRIGERGVRLSGGQKQRLSIARAVLRGSPVLIFDEATASVDVETEREIQQAIDALAGSKTIIVIAHRLSTVRRADTIYVLEEARVAQKGSHEELLKDEAGPYARICAAQFRE